MMTQQNQAGSPKKNKRKAVFLDRDGTVIRDKHYLSDPEEIEFFPGTFEALTALLNEGFELVIVTNQSGVARGLMTEEDVQAVHERLEQLLAEKEIHLLDIYYAPYHPEAEDPRYLEGRECRKPRPGMLEQAREEHNIDYSRSYMIGDKRSDVEAGRRAGCKSILVKTGKGRETLQEDDDFPADHIADNLPAAADWICSDD